MTFSLLSGLVLGGLFGPPAQATEGLQWQWGDSDQRAYMIRSRVFLPQFMQFNKERNGDARVTEFVVTVITTCSVVDKVGKDRWELKCSIDDFSIAGAPPKSDAGKLMEVFDEMDQKLVNGGWVQMVFSADGRIVDYDLEGVDKSNTRNRHIQENMRLILGRLFAAMDLQLPLKGVDSDQSWEQKSSPLAMHFPSASGTFGASDVVHQVTKSAGDRAEIATSGRGTLGPGEFYSPRTGSDRLKNQYDLEYRGITVFDTANGNMVEHEYLVEGMPTPSSLAAEGSEGIGYVQETRLELIPEDTKPVLGPNEEIAPQRQYATGAVQGQ